MGEQHWRNIHKRSVTIRFFMPMGATKVEPETVIGFAVMKPGNRIKELYADTARWDFKHKATPVNCVEAQCPENALKETVAKLCEKTKCKLQHDRNVALGPIL